MTVFLSVTAAVAVVIGLMGLVAGHWPRAAGRRKTPCASGASWFLGAG
jgi:hypothetical protein